MMFSVENMIPSGTKDSVAVVLGSFISRSPFLFLETCFDTGYRKKISQMLMIIIFCEKENKQSRIIISINTCRLLPKNVRFYFFWKVPLQRRGSVFYRLIWPYMKKLCTVTFQSMHNSSCTEAVAWVGCAKLRKYVPVQYL
jgi:hypothetical protein